MKYWQYVIKITFKFIFIGSFLSQFILQESPAKHKNLALMMAKKENRLPSKW